MSQFIFLPGFDGDATLRGDFLAEIARRHEVRGISYPNHPLGSLDAYRAAAMAQVPVDWKPVLIAESFSGLVAAQWASIDSRVQALVLCGAFARNPIGYAVQLASQVPALVKLGPFLMNPAAQLSGDPARRRWSSGFVRSVAALRNDVVAERLRLISSEDVGAVLAGLAIPLVCVQFTDDLVVVRRAREELESACPRARVVNLPGPHFAIEVRPKECAAAIERALGLSAADRA